MKRFLLPLAIFVVMVGFLAVGLTLNPREVPSPLVGKAAPDFSLPQLHESDKVFSPKELAGKVWLLNFWASWCNGCKDEHPVLMQMAKSGDVPIYGVDYKDTRQEALTWLRAMGESLSAGCRRRIRPGWHQLWRVWSPGDLRDR